MGTSCGNVNVDEDKQLELPPGFRFKPSDEELVSHYLATKVVDPSFRCLAVGDANLNKCEPWDLPWRAKMGDEEWYFFSLKNKKYSTGSRSNHVTESGYWKASGRDKKIYKMNMLVGMKKILIFYRGRVPNGVKTNWVMHEFRVDENYAAQNLPVTAKNDWVISRVFEKCSGGKKIHITNTARNSKTISQRKTEGNESQGTCFSNPSETQLQEIKKTWIFLNCRLLLWRTFLDMVMFFLKCKLFDDITLRKLSFA